MQRRVTGKMTAIARTGPSRPARWIVERGLAMGRVLDYGCGRGFDADFYGWTGYDPGWRPAKPRGRFDIVVCIYVLHILPRGERKIALDDIESVLRPGGTAYLAVRGDVRGQLGRGVRQRRIVLDLPILRNGTDWALYALTRG